MLPPTAADLTSDLQSKAYQAEETPDEYEEETDEPLELAEDPPLPQAVKAPAEPTLTVEAAAARLGPKILQKLEEKFNGSLVQVRAADEKDQLF